MAEEIFNKGSEWRKWDLHVHTPFSALNNQFGDDWDLYIKTLFNKAIEKNIVVIGVTDYFTIEGYKKINEYLVNSAKMKELFEDDQLIAKIKNILILPNIEFRLHPLNGRRINFHVIFSKDVPVQDIEENFLHNISFVREGQPFEEDEKRKLKIANLEELGKKLKSEHEPFRSKSDLIVGMENAVVQDSEISDLLVQGKSIFKGRYVTALPADEDLSNISWNGQDHNTRKKLIQKINFIFSSNQSTIEWSLGKKHASAEDYKKEFKTLKPCIWGSDAHDFDKLFEPDNQKYTWIKSDPIFAGLKQLLNEPECRVFIGDTAPNYKSSHKIISEISISDSKGWFDENFNLRLNRDLVSIIGGRGSGKSALAEAIAYGAGSFDKSGDAFLKKASKHPKRSINGAKVKLLWENGSTTEFEIGQLKEDQGVIKYLPQGVVERLCSPELENSKELQQQIENVIFQRLDDTEKMGSSDFDELKNKVLKRFNSEKEQLREKIINLNSKIVSSTTVIDSLKEKEKLVADKKNELEKVIKDLPVLQPDDQKKQEDLARLLLLKRKFEDKIIELKEKLEKIIDIETKIKLFKEKISDYNVSIKESLSGLAITTSDPFLVKMDDEEINKILLNKRDSFNNAINVLKAGEKSDVIVNLGVGEDELLEDNLNKLNITIDKINNETKAFEISKLKYQQQKKIASDLEISIKAIEDEILSIKTKTAPERKRLEDLRLDTYISFFGILKSEKEEIEKLYIPLQQSLLHGTDTDKKLKFEAKINYQYELHCKNCIDILDRTRKGNFRDVQALNKELEVLWRDFLKNNFDENDIKQALNNINVQFCTYEGNEIGVVSQLRDHYNLEDYYNWIFDTSHFNIISSLQFDDTDLYLLSPGQKGIILLMLYLEIDKEDRRPLIIDQPEENLDNLSIYKDLIDFFRERKLYRQIIVVTHNPNLVVNTDSEQVIIANYNGKRVPCLQYISGSLENHSEKILENEEVCEADGIIEQVCNILEGGESAFDSRKKKYQISVKS